MNISLNRIILFVRDVPLLTRFYRDPFGLPIVEEIDGEWVVLKAGPCELGLHRVGERYRQGGQAPDHESNAKLVLTVDSDLDALRTELIGKGVKMGEIKRFPGMAGPLCDGRDPEGNVFQLVGSGS